MDVVEPVKYFHPDDAALSPRDLEIKQVERQFSDHFKSKEKQINADYERRRLIESQAIKPMDIDLASVAMFHPATRTAGAIATGARTAGKFAVKYGPRLLKSAAAATGNAIKKHGPNFLKEGIRTTGQIAAIDYGYEEAKGEYNTLTERFSSMFPPEGLSAEELIEWDKELKRKQLLIPESHKIGLDFGGSLAMGLRGRTHGIYNFGGTLANEIMAGINLSNARQPLIDK
jgi:hypothetical protein